MITSCNMLFEEFLHFLERYFTDTFLFMDADYGSLLAHALTFHFFDDNLLFKVIFFDQIMQTIFYLFVVFATLLAIAEVNYFFRFFRFAHIVKMSSKNNSFVFIYSK